MKRKGKNAISLIVLVITILVLSILAATVIISLSNTNIIGETSKTVLKSNLTAMQDMATVYFADNYETIDMEKEYSITEFEITDDEFKKYRDYAFVKAGKVYIKLNAPEDIQEVAEELNMLIDGTSSSTGEVAVEKTVKALRIYGNTESEESVGEKSKNIAIIKSLSNIKEENGIYTTTISDDADSLKIKMQFSIVGSSGTSYLTQYVAPDLPGRYSITITAPDEEWKHLRLANSGKTREFSIFFDLPYEAYKGKTITISFTIVDSSVAACSLKDIQIEEGSTATDYEPYGYKLPVRVTGSDATDKTYNIYLTEPLRKLGNVADYVDCTTGEVVRYIGVTSAGELEVLSTPVKESVTLEEMNFEGASHIFVDTTVTPSNIEVK